ncbi:SDR family NAD(P)-dependent oxidoreductase, partial [Halovivax sp.]|uniref:SDR family NAD(P)-dependent oxidoreductase n=1 Tax=Halovivax sp. TaxID=1935978 RepID=UPI0025BC7122
MKLDDRTAIVTGASSGIGRAIAIEFAREGANVVIADVRESSRVPNEDRPTAEAVDAAGGAARFERTDVTDGDDVRELVDRTVEAFGGVDILVNGAGITTDGSVEAVDDDEWDRIHDVNVKGIVRCSKRALPHLRESDHGRIVNISSQRGLRGGASPEKAAYVSSKGAVTNLTRQMALDYGPEGIAVNAICPGPVESGMTPIEDEDDRQALLAGILTPFVGQPEDVAPAAVLLASDGGRY